MNFIGLFAFCQSILIHASLKFLTAVLVCDTETQAISGSNELILLLFCSRWLIEVKRQRSMSFGL